MADTPAPEPQEAGQPDRRQQAVDVLEQLGVGPYKAEKLLRDHSPLDILAAEEELNAAEQRKDIAHPKSYFLKILAGPARKAAGKGTTKEIRHPSAQKVYDSMLRCSDGDNATSEAQSDFLIASLATSLAQEQGDVAPNHDDERMHLWRAIENDKTSVAPYLVAQAIAGARTTPADAEPPPEHWEH